MIIPSLGTQFRPALRRALLGLTSASLLVTTTLTPVSAQGFAPGMQQGTVAVPMSNAYSAEELEAILAPVALYPDQLLTQVLMAAAFPEQVAAAARWAQGNRNLRGDNLDRALRQVPWDPAVKSLVPFPQVLEMLAGHTEWMAQLAFAVAAQEAATFDAIQRLRRKAWLVGQLRSTHQQVVRMDGDLIIIEPAAPNLVYVPVYNPQIVYGVWAYPAYPPYYFPPRYFVPGDVLATGIFFGLGVVVVGSLWGWATPRWHDRYFYVDRNRYEYFRHFHRPPPNDWGRWERDRWRPPTRPDDSQFRPPPVRPGDGQFRPPPRPDGAQVRPPPSRPDDGQVRPPPSRPDDGQVRPPPPRSGDGQVRPPPSRPDDGQVRPPPPRSGDGQVRPPPSRGGDGQVHPPSRQEGGERFRAPPAGGDGPGRSAPPSDGQRGRDRQQREN